MASACLLRIWYNETFFYTAPFSSILPICIVGAVTETLKKKEVFYQAISLLDYHFSF